MKDKKFYMKANKRLNTKIDELEQRVEGLEVDLKRSVYLHAVKVEELDEIPRVSCEGRDEALSAIKDLYGHCPECETVHRPSDGCDKEVKDEKVDLSDILLDSFIEILKQHGITEVNVLNGFTRSVEKQCQQALTMKPTKDKGGVK